VLYSRIHRLLKIVTLIQSRTDWNAAKLARACGVVERTVYRDIDQLIAAGIRIQFDHESGGYRFADGFFLPPVNLTQSEAISLSVLCRDIADKEQVACLKPAHDAWVKIESTLSEQLRQRIARLENAVAIRTARSEHPNAQREAFEQILNAILNRRALRCVCEAMPPDRSHFRLEPYALYFCVHAWHVIGRTSEHEDVRNFRLSRLDRVSETGSRYEIPDSFSIDGHLGSAWLIANCDNEHEVEIRFDAGAAHSVADIRWRPDQRIESHEDGTITFRCVVAGLDEIAWWILGMGPRCVVQRPAELRERVMQLARQTMARYGH